MTGRFPTPGLKEGVLTNLGQLYLAELGDKDTTESNISSFYLDLFLSIGRNGQLSPFSLRQTRWFQLQYHKFFVPVKQYSIFASLWRFNLLANTLSQGLLVLLMFCSKGGATFVYAPQAGIWTFEIGSQEVLWSIWGSQQTLWSLPLPNVTWHSSTWAYKATPSIYQTLQKCVTLFPNWALLPTLTL